MKVLVTGINGQLGYDVLRQLERQGHEAIGVDRQEMDLLDPEKIKEVIMTISPEAVIHCGAYTAVDRAEVESDICYQINAEAVKVIASCVKELGITLIYMSTDYVFDGTKPGEYIETDLPHPINIYGASKLKGEQYVQSLLSRYYIVRISWVFGANGNNFVKTMQRLGGEHDEIKVIDDQMGSPTYTADLAPLLIEMLEAKQYGIYHVTNEGFCSWYDFAKEIFEQGGMEVKITPVRTDQYCTRAKRPLNSKLSKEKLKANGFSTLPHWKQALSDFLNKQ